MRDSLIIVFVWLAAVLGLGAAPPAIPEKIETTVGGTEFFDVKLEAGKTLGMVQHFEKSDCVLVRLWSDDPAVQSYMIVARKAGTFHVAAWTVGEAKGVKLAIVVGGSGPGPVPAPDGKFGLIKASRDGLAKVADKADSVALARAQRSHASAVAAGAFADAPAITVGWRAANRAAVTNPTAWANWATMVSAALASAHATGKLVTFGDWADAFREIADGLGGN